MALPVASLWQLKATAYWSIDNCLLITHSRRTHIVFVYFYSCLSTFTLQLPCGVLCFATALNHSIVNFYVLSRKKMINNFKTFVFFDIEATGLPDHEFNKTKITELALIACSKVELLKTDGKRKVPRVLHKLTICVNPRKMISPESTKITGKETITQDRRHVANAFIPKLHFQAWTISIWNMRNRLPANPAI